MLTRRAYLNVLAAFIDQGARVAVSLVLTPILVSSLGSLIFGVWQMLSRISLHLSTLDGRSSEALKWMVANMQASSDDQAKRRAVSSALVIWLAFLPLLCLVGMALVLWFPGTMGIGEREAADVKLATAFVVVNVILLSIIAIWAAVLRGMNLGYKRMGIMATITIVGGVAMAMAAKMGLGLSGIAAAQILASTIAVVAFVRVVGKHVPWMGSAAPTTATVREMFQVSKWFMVLEFVSSVNFMADVVVLGYIDGSEIVTRYVVTAFAVQAVTLVISTAVSAVLPGLGGIIGRKDFAKAAALRDESILYSWLLAASIGATILMCNPSFVALWVEGNHYAGHLENLMIVLVAFQLVFIRVDDAIINVTLNIRKKVLLSALSSIVTLTLTISLTSLFSVTGLCVGLLAGRLILGISYPRIARSFLRDKSATGRQLPNMAWLLTATLFALSYYVGQHMLLERWWELILFALLSFGGLLFACYWIGLSRAQKSVLITRLRVIKMW